MIKEHDRIILCEDIPGEGLKAGDVGTVVHVYPRKKAFEVEFMTLDGKTVTVVTLLSKQVREVTGKDITHSREHAVA